MFAPDQSFKGGRQALAANDGQGSDIFCGRVQRVQRNSSPRVGELWQDRNPSVGAARNPSPTEQAAPRGNHYRRQIGREHRAGPDIAINTWRR